MSSNTSHRARSQAEGPPEPTRLEVCNPKLLTATEDDKRNLHLELPRRSCVRNSMQPTEIRAQHSSIFVDLHRTPAAHRYKRQSWMQNMQIIIRLPENVLKIRPKHLDFGPVEANLGKKSVGYSWNYLKKVYEMSSENGTIASAYVRLVAITEGAKGPQKTIVLLQTSGRSQ